MRENMNDRRWWGIGKREREKRKAGDWWCTGSGASLQGDMSLVHMLLLSHETLHTTKVIQAYRAKSWDEEHHAVKVPQHSCQF